VATRSVPSGDGQGRLRRTENNGNDRTHYITKPIISGSV